MPTRQTLISGTADDPATTGIEFAPLLGNGNSPWWTDEEVYADIISAPGKLTNFRVQVKTAPGDSKYWVFAVRKGSPGGAMATTPLGGFIIGTAVLSDLDTDVVTVAAGDRVALMVYGVGTPTAAGAVYWRCDFIPDTDGETILLGDTMAYPLSSTYRNTLIGSKVPDSLVFDAETLFPTSGTLKRFYVGLQTAPGNGNTWTLTAWKNGIAQSLAVAISNSGTTGNDTDPAHNISIAAGDTVLIRAYASGTPASSYATFGMTFLPDTLGEFIASATTDDATSTAQAEYQQLNCGDSLLTVTEEEQHSLASEATAKKMYVSLYTAPGNGNSWIFTLREGLADTALTVTISNTNTSGNAAVDEAIAADALVDTFIDGRAGSNTSKIQIAYLLYIAPTAGPAGVKTLEDVAIASVKTINDTVIASVKTINDSAA